MMWICWKVQGSMNFGLQTDSVPLSPKTVAVWQMEVVPSPSQGS